MKANLARISDFMINQMLASLRSAGQKEYLSERGSKTLRFFSSWELDKDKESHLLMPAVSLLS